MQNYLELHRLEINLWISVITLLLIPVLGYFVKAWIRDVVSSDVCRRRQAECREEFSKNMGQGFISRSETMALIQGINGNLENFAAQCEGMKKEISQMNQNLIAHINHHS